MAVLLEKNVLLFIRSLLWGKNLLISNKQEIKKYTVTVPVWIQPD